MILAHASVIFFVVLQVMLLPVQGATLMKLLKGGNNRKAIKVTLWFFFSNIAYIIGFLCIAFINDSAEVTALCAISALCLGIFFFGQSEAHFEFTFNYFNVVIVIPYILDRKNTPNQVKTCMMSYLWAWRISNLILSILYGIYNYELNKATFIYKNEQS